MAITAGNTLCQGTTGVITAPFTRNQAFDAGSYSNRFLVVFVRSDRAVSTGIWSCTYAGVAMNAGPQQTADYANNTQTFWLLGDGNVTAGSNNIALTSTGTCGISINAIVMNGVDSLRDSTIYSSNGNASTLVQSVASSSGDSTVWLVFSNIGTTKEYTGVAPTTIIDQGGARVCMSWRTADDPSTSMSVTHNYGSSRTWGGHIMALTPAVGGSAGVPKANKMLLGIG